MDSLISIISIYYNRKDFVKESINSLLNQTYKNTEIIIIDDGSTDGTYEELKKIEDNRLRIYTQENMGFVKSIIKAIDLSEGEYIAIHGSGDISHSTRIEKQVNFLNENSEYGLISNYANKETLDKKRSQSVSDNFENDNYIDTLLKKNILVHGSTMFRKEIYDKVGGYRDFFKFGQDRDLWLRMCQITKPYIIPEVLYTMRVLPESVSNDFNKTIFQLYFRSMSNQCIIQRLRNETDIIDTFDVSAPFLRDRDKDLAKAFLRLATVEISKDNLINALKAVQLSTKEKRLILNESLKLVIIFSLKFNFAKVILVNGTRKVRKNKVM